MSSRIFALLVVGLGGVLACPAAAAQEGEPVPVALAARDLPRGSVLKPGDFVLAAPAAGEEGPVGWVTRRVVTEGEPLRAPTIAPLDVIRSGDTVQLVYESGTLQLRLSGRAMSSGAVGETVRVRVDTQRRFEGTVLGAGIVRLDSPDTGR